MIKIIFCILAALLPVMTYGVNSFGRCDVTDMALIYQGGAHRIDWTEDDFSPYVSHKFASGEREWLFDGFLFLEFKDGRGHQFSPGYDSLNARREHWEWYIDRLFAPDRSLHALDAAIGKAADSLGLPPFRHKVVLTIMVPIPGQTDWGEVCGKSMDFNKRADQLRAIEWFVDALMNRFSGEHFKYLDLHGMYWIDEDMVATKDLTAQVSPYIHARGLKFYWIPYFRAPGHSDWRELGFDMAFHQPNHFFDSTIADSRLDDAIDIALANGMCMEMECDEKALEGTEGDGAERMRAYINAFERRGVWENSPVAYYTGNHLLLDFFRNPTAENRRLADELAAKIVGRPKKF